VIEFRLLGPLELETPDGPLPLGGARQRALLAILLLEAGRVVPTERLVDHLWGEGAPRTATTSLHNAVSALRKLLGAERHRPPRRLRGVRHAGRAAPPGRCTPCRDGGALTDEQRRGYLSE
jgi:DNA-binding SARP family transcriptional activator